MEDLRSQVEVYKKNASDYQRKIKKLETSNSDLRRDMDSRHLQMLEEKRKELLSGHSDRSASADRSSGYLRRHSSGIGSSPSKRSTPDSESRSESRGRTRRGGDIVRQQQQSAKLSAAGADRDTTKIKISGPDWLKSRLEDIVQLKIDR